MNTGTIYKELINIDAMDRSIKGLGLYDTLHMLSDSTLTEQIGTLETTLAFKGTMSEEIDNINKIYRDAGVEIKDFKVNLEDKVIVIQSVYNDEVGYDVFRLDLESAVNGEMDYVITRMFEVIDIKDTLESIKVMLDAMVTFEIKPVMILPSNEYKYNFKDCNGLVNGMLEEKLPNPVMDSIGIIDSSFVETTSYTYTNPVTDKEQLRVLRGKELIERLYKLEIDKITGMFESKGYKYVKVMLSVSCINTILILLTKEGTVELLEVRLEEVLRFSIKDYCDDYVSIDNINKITSSLILLITINNRSITNKLPNESEVLIIEKIKESFSKAFSYIDIEMYNENLNVFKLSFKDREHKFESVLVPTMFIEDSVYTGALGYLTKIVSESVLGELAVVKE